MNSFDELLTRRMRNETIKRFHALKRYNRSDDFAESHLAKKQADYSTRVLANLEETVQMEIADHANRLFLGIKDSMDNVFFAKLFRNDFKEYIFALAALAVSVDGSLEQGFPRCYNKAVQDAALYLGFTLEDIAFFVGKEMNDETKDTFMSMINNHFGTNIPMTKEIKDAYSASPTGDSAEITLLDLRQGFYINNGYPTYYAADILGLYPDEEPSRK